ncbi:hypothetical protein PHYBOEH_001065 [Phytophthora boehmeriae]|uniref:Expansin-like EG45 domain-containing protein n=1 Tax=Phytophthora boehmeriae TaxID=109152 RepID=A0A8T1WZT0_9STRA|nr:hypothetical protein PHYBOEH_001065 [Phytophthora boehmeriae]
MVLGLCLRTAPALLFGAVALVAADEYFTGDGTSYTLSQVSSGNCNFMSAGTSASTNYVALNQEQWDNLGNCGRCIEVSCVDDQCTAKNKTAVVQVLDRCPECKSGDLDLSPTVYKEITGLDPNRLKVRWRFVDCPDVGNVQVCLKEGSNANWIAIQPTNAAVGVTSVTVDGAATTMLEGAYYYVQSSASADLSAVKVSITSVGGDVIDGTYALTAGKCVDTEKQFGGGSTSQSSPATTAPKPAATTATPTATTATPSATEPTQTQTGSSASGGGVYSSSQNQDTSASNSTDTSTPDTTTATPEATTATPEATPATPESTPAAPESTPSTPQATTATPEATTASPTTDSPVQTGDTSKCRVRGRRHRN